MTRTEFLQKIGDQKKTGDHVGKWMLGFLAVFALLVIFSNKYADRLPLSDDARGSILMITMFSGLFTVLYIFGNRARKRSRALGLNCPKCKKDFANLSLQVVIASGRCGRCGAVVLEDWNK